MTTITPSITHSSLVSRARNSPRTRFHRLSCPLALYPVPSRSRLMAVTIPPSQSAPPRSSRSYPMVVRGLWTANELRLRQKPIKDLPVRRTAVDSTVLPLLVNPVSTTYPQGEVSPSPLRSNESVSKLIRVEDGWSESGVVKPVG